MIKYFKRTIKDKRVKKLKEYKVGSWVYIENPTPQQLDKISKKFSLERDLLGDALDLNEVPRVETENGDTYVFTRIPYREKGRVGTVPLLVGMTKNFLFTVCVKPLPFLDLFIENKIDFYTTQKTKLFAQIFFQINATYSGSLNEINKTVRSLTGDVEKISNKDITRFVVFERTLNDFLSALVPMNSLLSSILSGKAFRLYEGDKDLVEDVYLTSGQLIELGKLNVKSITNIRESYSTLMTNNLNSVIKLLTALTVVLTVPTMVASFYGMNVNLPGAQSDLAFLWIVGVTAMISLAVLGVFAYKKWL